MISKQEILAVANETGLTPHVVEKDYVLGWLLAAVDAHAAFSDSWIFKGGTCLKKCYFETYRFSEDLDFTLTDENHLNEAFLLEQFGHIAEWIYEKTGLEIATDRLVFDVYQNPRGQFSCEGRVYYQSYFSSGKKSLPKIKFDLTANEVLVLTPSRQKVVHTYSDIPDEGIFIACYAYPEVFGEKVRALGERGRPRDLYDVINLFRNNYLPPAAIIKDVLKQKCVFKGIEPPKMEDMENYKPLLFQNWEPMLAHQLPALPSLDTYWIALPEFFDWLVGRTEITKLPPKPVTASGELYRPLYGQLGLQAGNGESLELIRFAASNRICVDLDYTDKDGNRRSRIIEPYSLRRAKNGNILLYAVRADDGGIRAYSIQGINSASVTDRVYTPRFDIELSPSVGLESITETSRSSSSLGLPRNTKRRNSTRFSSSPWGSKEIKYAYECPMCGKMFHRKKQNSALNPHKDKQGYPCYGRSGIYQGTNY